MIKNGIVMPDTLINIDYFAAYSQLPSNYNYDEIIPYFKISEKIWVEPIIGTQLYEELLEQVKDNTITPVNATLLLEIYPYLSQCIVFESLPFITYHLTEVGITKGHSDNSTSVDTKDVNYINNKVRATIETLKNNLIEFLNKNKDYYPLYRPTTNDCECMMDYNNINSICKLTKKLNKPNPYFQGITPKVKDNKTYY